MWRLCGDSVGARMQEKAQRVADASLRVVLRHELKHADRGGVARRQDAVQVREHQGAGGLRERRLALPGGAELELGQRRVAARL